MTISGKMKDSCTFEELRIGKVFSFANARQKIWDELHQYSTHEEYLEKEDEDDENYRKYFDDYLGEELYILCWDGAPADVDTEYAFHPKFISLKDGCIHDMIEEQEFEDYNYYSEVRVYDTCRSVEPDYDDCRDHYDWHVLSD